MNPELKTRLKSTWMAGDYGRFARYMEGGAEEFVARLGLAKGSRVLDVGCGAGQIALIAARQGARVTGCDIAVNWLEQARVRAAEEGLDAVFEEGDAEMLPFEDRSFDAVITLVGAMFAPRPEAVASEMIRVCRPGGMIAMGNWTPGGFIGQMFRLIAQYIAPPGVPSPVLWGDEDTCRTRLDGVADLRMIRRMYPFEYPFRPPEVVEFFRTNYGPMERAFGALEGDRREELRQALTDHWASANQSSNGSTLVQAEYLEVVARV